MNRAVVRYSSEEAKIFVQDVLNPAQVKLVRDAKVHPDRYVLIVDGKPQQVLKFR